ncbi:PadR family transcriptional regulator [Kitasatospora sp. CB01950]|uniref:PadR family transcriptional regulator n=1 Tax=Kitasatospora sp. CB01950 TaxID=1703930 RepID=UPI00093C9107|nr:PadR family transcriptional regulator [Kitasatospora sp. CB01950]OKJ10493.1 PadR family transcriptional regulator [Kitasatospora sp. CB01950]
MRYDKRFGGENRRRWAEGRAEGEEFGMRSAFGPFGAPGRPMPPFGPGFGPRGHGFGGHGTRGHGGGGRRGGRARRGDVRASLLALLRERPMHGYEMITEIGERTGGVWRPSPGSVYPTLQLLEEEGLIKANEESGKKLFELTEQGRAEAEQGTESPWAEAGRRDDWEAVQEVGAALAAVDHAVRQVMMTGTEEQRAKGLAVLAEAKKKLYLILAEEA